MRPILVLRHGDDIPLGLLGEAIDSAGLEVHEIMLHRGDRIPLLDAYSALVVLGGVMGAYDETDHPWLGDEKQVIRAAHDRDMPMLGICLGGQLFASALGGSAELAADGPEIGHLVPTLTEDGTADRVLRHFDQPVVVFHQDAWQPPRGATVLARTDRFHHAFRHGPAVAIQAHPEATADIVEGWVSKPASQNLMDQAGVTAEALLAAVRNGEPMQREMAHRMFGAWLQEVLDRETDRGSAGSVTFDPGGYGGAGRR